MPAPVTTNPQTLLASNTSAIYIKTQTTLGACVWDFTTPTTGFPLAGDAVRVLGTPSFTPRGAGIIARGDQMTPWGGMQAPRTGGLGWDITMQTELYWQFSPPADTLTLPNTQLAPLFRAMPWDISLTGTGGINTTLAVQPFFVAGVDNSGSPVTYRDTTAYACEPFSICMVETNGEVFAAYDCIATCKLSWDYGQRIMLDWTIKGKWVDVASYSSSFPAPAYATIADQPPLVGTNCSVAMGSGSLLTNINALDKISFEPGWGLQDVGDMREQYGFGLGFAALTNAPTIEMQVADFTQTLQPDWTQAQANTSSLTCAVTITVGANTITITLNNCYQMAFPSKVDSNGHRATGIKLGASPTSNTTQATIVFV
jgi:hypothetical protein